MLTTFELDSKTENKNAEKEIDYEKKYFDLKDKYYLLFEQLQDLTKTLTKSNNRYVRP